MKYVHPPLLLHNVSTLLPVVAPAAVTRWIAPRGDARKPLAEVESRESIKHSAGLPEKTCPKCGANNYACPLSLAMLVSLIEPQYRSLLLLYRATSPDHKPSIPVAEARWKMMTMTIMAKTHSS